LTGAVAALCAWLALGLTPVASGQTSDISVQDITRLKGLGSDELWGMGLVFGLPGTGDSAKVVPKARQLAQLLEQAGNPIPGIEEALDTKSVAIVMVTASLPEESVVAGDVFHLSVQTMFDAKDLTGGRLFLTPMRGSLPGDPYVYAFGAGPVSPDGSGVPTVGRVSNGCRVIRDISKPVVSDFGVVTLQVRENYASAATTTLIANLINQDRQGLRADGAPPIAKAVNERSVVVEIPDEELSNPIRFIADLQKITFDASLLTMEPRIVINERAGVIMITGNVVIQESVVASGNLVVTTTLPEIPATLENPLITQSNSTAVGTTQNPKNAAQAQALLDAMRRLEIPVQDQIEVFRALERAGVINAQLEYL
jgi:flagellar P-ring protein precursor FlgI